MALKVSIIGTGSVGSTLGKSLLAHGAVVKYGSRNPASDKVKALLTAQPGASADTIPATVKWADAVIFAVPGAHDDQGIKANAAILGSDANGKVVIDVVNPISAYPALESRWTGKSGGELLAEALPDAYVFKAFNTIGVEHMDHGDGSLITDQPLTMLLAGPKDPVDKLDLAKKVVEVVGFKPEYVGPIRYARNLEAIAELWIHLGVPGVGTSEKWGRKFHFQVLRAPE